MGLLSFCCHHTYGLTFGSDVAEIILYYFFANLSFTFTLITKKENHTSVPRGIYRNLLKILIK